MPSRAEVFDDVADRIDAGAMPFDAGQMPLRGPAAVAVHDDGDVLRAAARSSPVVPAPLRANQPARRRGCPEAT